MKEISYSVYWLVQAIRLTGSNDSDLVEEVWADLQDESRTITNTQFKAELQVVRNTLCS